MAPPGKHVLSCFVQYAPYHLKGSDWDTERNNLGDTVQRTVESFFPGFSDLVLHREVVTPLDIERVVGLSEGNIYAGEFLLPQMYFFRPAPGYAQYRTPIDGYYQCGSGTHPGGCVMGAPGRLASQEILKDRASNSGRLGKCRNLFLGPDLLLGCTGSRSQRDVRHEQREHEGGRHDGNADEERRVDCAREGVQYLTLDIGWQRVNGCQRSGRVSVRLCARRQYAL